MSKLVLPNGHRLVGNGDYPWLRPVVEGDDLVCDDVRVTCFGGPHDAGDDGHTASGFVTKTRPDVPGCALALADRSDATAGSPIPGNLPWGIRPDGSLNPGGTMVRVFGPVDAKTPHLIIVPLMDVGPSISGKYATHNAIDLTPGAMLRLLGLEGQMPADDARLIEMSCKVHFRILQGAVWAAEWAEHMAQA